MPIKGKDGLYRPLWTGGKVMTKDEYDRHMERRRITEETGPLIPRDRKYNTKGTDYIPGKISLPPMSAEQLKHNLEQKLLKQDSIKRAKRARPRRKLAEETY